MTRALVVGLGAAGMRHRRALVALGASVSAVSRRAAGEPDIHAELAAGLNAAAPDYVVVADETGRHHDTLARLAECGYAGRVLVEKPLFAHALAPPPNRFEALFVGYQLRFHPLVARVKQLLGADDWVTAQLYVGQHLSGWRPGRPYQETYSARAGGGGALRDLSHEIDLLLWLFGGWRRLAALGGGHRALAIEADDAFALLVECSRCPVATVQVNYLDRHARRQMLINGAETTIFADLVTGQLRAGESDECQMPADNDAPTRAMHAAALAARPGAPAEGGDDRLCSLAEGLGVVRVIDAAERAARERRWVAA